MPFNFQQINPVDLNPNVGVGVNLPFSGPSVFSPNYLTSQAIKNNLINFFLTNPGEIPLNPTFGGGLRAFIFEQMSEGTLTGIENSINYSLETFFPNIIVNSLEVLKDDDTNTITIKLTYSVVNSNINETITFQL
jgi:phage baseplate assembly protein W